jgi:hypothetical protein
VSKGRRNAKATRALREKRTSAREFGLNAFAAEQWLRERLNKNPSSEKVAVQEERRS